MSDTSESERQVAFIAAAAVLLALPLLAMFGLAAIALVTQAGANAEMKWLAWVLFFAWVVLVVTAVLVFAVRFVRRSS
jgi:threonine/homoserine/homoserine lactone efflux protein